MTSEEKLISAFSASLGVPEDEVKELNYHGVQPWDSIGHLSLIQAIEDAFDIMMSTEDIIKLSSFEKAVEILKDNYDVEF